MSVPSDGPFNGVNFDTVEYDNAGMSVGAVNVRIPMSGIYLVVGTFSWAPSATGVRKLIVAHAPSPLSKFANSEGQIAPLASDPTVQTISTIARFNQDDYVKFGAVSE